jgi:transcriptional regulator with XRE-family HTH domain
MVPMEQIQISNRTPLSVYVSNRLAELGLRQSEFCRLYGFDQGLLSKIQNSIVANLSLESVLRLAIGLRASPRDILGLIGRMDMHELVRKSYSIESEERINV